MRLRGTPFTASLAVSWRLLSGHLPLDLRRSEKGTGRGAFGRGSVKTDTFPDHY